MNPQKQNSGLENNSPGGVPIFRGIDQSEAFLIPYYSTGKSYASLQSLESWFSAPRMRRYAAANRPDLLYIWDTQLSKAFLEDICHVEVLLRNFIHNRLTKDSRQADWYNNAKRYHFNKLFKRSVSKVEKNLKKRGRAATPDQVIAELSFDNWRFLLIPRHEVTIWKALINPANGGMPHYPGRKRAAFEEDIELIRQLRNRASHQEPLIMEATLIDDETEQLDKYAAAILNTAKRLDPEAADWIIAHSRVDSIRKQRPN